MNKTLSVIIPVFNEQESIFQNTKIINDNLNDLVKESLISEFEIIIVDDGSTDKSWEEVLKLSASDIKIIAIRLTKNFGHQSALIAGLDQSNNDMLLTIDADLQDDISAIKKMIEKIYDGNEIVFGVRNNRKTDSLFKKISANFYYFIIKKLNKDMIQNHADFRLITRKCFLNFKEYKEVNLFLRGIFSSMYSRYGIVHYSRKNRKKGVTKYTLLKMVKLGLDGITSFSLTPLRLVFYLGLIISILSLIIISYYLYLHIFKSVTIKGWASTVLPIYFLGGIQLLSIGLIAEYIGKIFLETKKRPKYIIDEKINK